jgi:cell division protein WhiA
MTGEVRGTSPRPAAAGGFTDAVKQELAQLPLGEDDETRAELAALVRFGGALVVPGGGSEILVTLESTSGATIRRAFALLQHRYELHPELRTRAPGGVQRRTLYGLRVVRRGSRVAVDLGLLDNSSRPVERLDMSLSGPAALATIRGAFLAAGSCSGPDRPPHLEIAAHEDAIASDLATLLRAAGVPATAGSPGRARPRVALKSGAAIAELLAKLGATSAYLHYEERRLRRQVRSEATRLANADAANLRRAVAAASTQLQAVHKVVANLGWDELDADLRDVALARLANPEASLTDLGALLDPPCSKSAVHRRMRRLEAIAARLQD